MEGFFVAQGMSKGGKLAIATVSLEGEALAWFQWDKGHRLVQSWMEFKARHLDRFGQF